MSPPALHFVSASSQSGLGCPPTFKKKQNKSTVVSFRLPLRSYVENQCGGGGIPGSAAGKSGQGGNAKEAGEIGGGDLSNEASAFYKQ